MTANRIAELLTTDEGRAQVVEMMNDASTEIDDLCFRWHGFNLTGNMDKLNKEQIIGLIANGVNLKGRKAAERKPYSDD